MRPPSAAIFFTGPGGMTPLAPPPPDSLLRLVHCNLVLSANISPNNSIFSLSDSTLSLTFYLYCYICLSFFQKKILEDISCSCHFLWFWLVTSVPGFKARVDHTCVLRRLHAMDSCLSMSSTGKAMFMFMFNFDTYSLRVSSQCCGVEWLCVILSVCIFHVFFPVMFLSIR